MILDTLLSIATLGAKKELFLQMESYQQYNNTAADQLRTIATTLEDGTEAKKHVIALTNLLDADKPKEFQIANHLIYIASIFRETGTPSPEEKELIGNYLKISQQFYQQSKTLPFTKKNATVSKSHSLNKSKRHLTCDCLQTKE